MRRKFYTEPRQHRIYALIDRELKVAFVGKSYARDLSSLYSKHVNGRSYHTADYFGKEPPKVKPELLILEEVHCTGAVAYKHVVAWSLYLEEHGFLMLTQTGTMLYSEQLLPETQEIYDSISQQAIEEVMQRTASLTRNPQKEKVVRQKVQKVSKPKLSIRVDKQDKDIFMELKRGMGVTQREVFHLLLDGVVFDHEGNYIPLIRRQKNQIQDLEQEVQNLKNQLAEERMSKKHDGRIREILNHAKTVTGKYVQMLMQDVYYLDDALRPVRKPRNNIHDFPYPIEDGHAVIQLEEIIYGSSTGMVFVLGWTEDEKPIKLRHYGKREFLGSDPRVSSYAVRGTWWQVHYRINKDGAADLMAALPLPPKAEQAPEKTRTALDIAINEIERQKE
ncbi:MAG: hypothetical protein IJP15_08155 [Oscillospiraceae bacterium]|nr:hypothetical protein [Oscillospiraceae bacterium]